MADLDAIERTALLTAALRAAETRRPDRLYADPYAAALAGDIGPRLLTEVREVTFPKGASRTLPSTPDYNAIRTRFFDDFLTAQAQDPRLPQVVIAPAGMDSRAYRLSWPEHIRLFEVDRPVVLAAKHDILGATESKVDRRPVAADMVDDDWETGLFDVGYDPALPSVWLLEGLLYYIAEPDVRRILTKLRTLTAPGSRIAADVVNAAALTLPNMRGLLDVFAGWGCPWLFGTDEPEELFGRYGVRARVYQPGDEGADYGRWPDPVPSRSKRGVRRVFFVTGVRED